MKRHHRLAGLAFTAVVLFGASALARGHTRRMFEPTDLEFDEPGVIDIDLQFGVLRSPGPWRVVIPDIEVDVGILSNLELAVSGGYAIEGPSSGPYAFDHLAADSVWPALKLGILDSRADDASSAFALGAALGPKLPAIAAQHGVGVEGLALFGFVRKNSHAVVSVGGFIDPRVDDSRPIAIEGGVDFAQNLDEQGRYSFTSELAGVRSLSGDPDQLTITAGGVYSPEPWLDLSLVVLGGLLGGSDRYGMLFGISPKVFASK